MRCTNKYSCDDVTMKALMVECSGETFETVDGERLCEICDSLELSCYALCDKCDKLHEYPKVRYTLKGHWYCEDCISWEQYELNFDN